MRSFFIFCCLLSTFSLHATEPLISSLLPRGGQLGSSQKVVINGQRLSETVEIFFYENWGWSQQVKSLRRKTEKLTAKFTISADAKIGQHELRIRTKKGISKLFTFGSVPIRILKKKNQTLLLKKRS